VERIRIKVRKTVWLTLSASPGQETIALAMLMGQLARDRQNAHILKTLGYKTAPGGSEQTRKKDGEVACIVKLTWPGTLTSDKCMEVCDWLAPLIFQAQRAGGTFAALYEALSNAAER
jgi:hypothetical protein